MTQEPLPEQPEIVLSVEEVCDRFGRAQDEPCQTFIERLALALDETCQRETEAAAAAAPPRAERLGPVKNKSGALDAEHQAVELTHYVSGQVTLAHPSGLILVDRPSWHKLRHRVDMLLGIPAPSPSASQQQEHSVRPSPSFVAAETRARLIDTATTAFKGSPKGEGTLNDVATAAIRAVCWAVAQELAGAPGQHPKTPDGSAPPPAPQGQQGNLGRGVIP